MEDNWVRPTSFNDPNSVWSTEIQAYDNNLETGASTATVSKYLDLILTEIMCDKIRIYVNCVSDPPQDPDIDIDVFYSAGWHNIYSGKVEKGVWVEKAIGSQQKVSKARIKYNVDIYTSFVVYEFNFNSLLLAVTTQDSTDAFTTSITGNGNITQVGVSDTTIRGFKYGLTKTDTWDVHDEGSFEAGAFTKGITGLNANTEYWIRAYVTNTEDTYYGAWVKFQTAAAGAVPTGTKVNICSDYSGYTYKLNKSLTDDGQPYKSHFVISTDLMEKQGLHTKKLLLDIYTYFEKKESGTCKIYVKRDNEPTWQYAGQISMVGDEGDEDILVRHLPSENQDSSGDVEFLAKHFLIKYEFTDDFDYIGSIFEFVPIGTR